jgi:hypothetical protein
MFCGTFSDALTHPVVGSNKVSRFGQASVGPRRHDGRNLSVRCFAQGFMKQITLARKLRL